MANKLYRRLTNLGANKHQRYVQIYLQAVTDGHLEGIRRLLKGKIKLIVPLVWSEHDEEEVYPIHIACAKGSLDVVKLLFRNGATLENKTDSGYTPLHFACRYNFTHPEVTGHLLDMGAKPSIKDKRQGQTPFHLACASNNFGAVKRLMGYTKPTVKDNNGTTAKDIAIENDYEQIVALFEEWDEESRRREELKRLPKRLEELERRTEVIMRHRSVQSLFNESRQRLSSGYCSTDGLNPHHIGVGGGAMAGSLDSFHTDGASLENGINSHRIVNSSLTSLNSTHNRLLHVPEQGCRFSHHGGEIASTIVANKHQRQSFSPVSRTFPECIEEELPQTKGSPLTRVQRTQVQRNYSVLQTMMKPDRVITKLFARLHLDLDAKEKISRMSTQEKNDFILTEYILRGTKGLYDDFLTILEDTQQGHLAERLKRLTDNPMYRSELIDQGHKESTV